MKHIPHSSRIFIGLLIITLLLTYVALTLTKYQSHYLFDYGQGRGDRGRNNQQHSEQPPVDTADWATYTDTNYPLTFSHPKTWIISSNKDVPQFYTVAIDVPNNNADIHIYISDSKYLGTEGLQQKPYTIDGAQGFNVNDTLIGVKIGEYYYTFDAALNAKQLSEFTALMKTVTFQ